MMWFVGFCRGRMNILRQATDDEMQRYQKLANELQPFQDNFELFERLDSTYEGLLQTAKGKKSKSFRQDEMDMRNAVANFLYAFKECLDRWEAFLIRSYGKISDYYSLFMKAMEIIPAYIRNMKYAFRV